MLRRLLPAAAALTLLLPATLGAQADPGPAAFAGTWEGTLDAGAARLRLVFHVALGDGGTLSGTMDSPDQGATGIAATSVGTEGRVLRFAVAPLALAVEVTLAQSGDTLAGTFTQGAARLPLTLLRVAAPTEPARPQHPRPPFPYRTEDVRIPNEGAGVTLAGTLSLPERPGPFPAAVLVSGSGPQDRDETLMGHKPFLVLADHLVRAGIAVLRYDDRGVGGSTGTFATATSRDFTSDALAAVAFLRARADIGEVGIVGHSEGGLVGPMAADASPDVAFVVMLAGPGLPGGEIIRLQSRLIGSADGTDDEVLAFNDRLQDRLFEAVLESADPEAAEPALRALIEEELAALTPELRLRLGASAGEEALVAQVRQVNSPWFRFFLAHDPRPVLERVRVPVLALFGGLDLQVPAEANLGEVEAALARGGNRDATVRTLPGLNHLFQTARTGSPQEYAALTETMSPAVLDAVSSWILERFAPTP